MRYATDSDRAPQPHRGAITTAAQAATALDSAVAVLAQNDGAIYRVTGMRSWNDRLVQISLLYDHVSGPTLVTTARNEAGSMLTVGLKARLCQALLDLALEHDPEMDPEILAARGLELFTTAIPTPAELAVDGDAVEAASLMSGSAAAVGCELNDCTIVVARLDGAGLTDQGVRLQQPTSALDPDSPAAPA